MNKVIYNYISSKVKIQPKPEKSFDDAYYLLREKYICISETLLTSETKGGEYILAHEYGHYVLDKYTITRLLQYCTALCANIIHSVWFIFFMIIIGNIYPGVVAMIILVIVSSILADELIASIIGAVTIQKLKALNRSEKNQGLILLYDAWTSYFIVCIPAIIISIASYFHIINLTFILIAILLILILFIPAKIKRIPVYIRYIQRHIIKSNSIVYEYERSLDDQ